MISKKSALGASIGAIALMMAGQSPAANDRTDNKPAAAVQSQQQIRADTLVGKDVKNIAGETIGDVESVIIDDSGKVAAVIVGVGGFLGMGERSVAIDWSQLKMLRNGDDTVIQTPMSKAELKSQPEYEYETADNRGRVYNDRNYLDRRDRSPDRRAARAEWMPATELRVSKLIGADVVNNQNDTIGEVKDLVVQDGRTKLILSVGEFLGMGGHDVAFDLDKAQIQREGDDADTLRVTVSMSKDQLKALPKYDTERWERKEMDNRDRAR